MSSTKYEKGAVDEVNVKMMPDSDRPIRPPEEEVEKYRKTRLVLFAVFLIVLIAMTVAAVIIIATAERCEIAEKGEPKEKEAKGKSWWDESLLAYQIYVPSFDNGKFEDIYGRISKFESLNVPVLSLSPIYADDDLKNVRSSFGKMEDFELMVKKLHDKKIEIVLDFDPRSTSGLHPWFTDSENENNNRVHYYIWRNGTKIVNSSESDPPNDWKNNAGNSSWKYSKKRKQFYLLSSTGQPMLNYKNADVKKEIKGVLQSWIDKKINGIKLKGVDELLVDIAGNIRKDLPGVHDILKDWHTAFNVSTKPIMIGEIFSTSDRKSYYGENELQSVVSYIKITKNAVELNKTLMAVFGNQGNDTASFAVDDIAAGRSAERLGGSQFSDAVNTLTLTMPGTPVWLYGQETGMIGGAKEKLNWGNDNNKVRKNYLKLAEMVKNNEDFRSEKLSVLVADKGYIAYRRGKYIVAINFGQENVEEIKTDDMNQHATVVFDSRGEQGHGAVNLGKVGLYEGQALIIKL